MTTISFEISDEINLLSIYDLNEKVENLFKGDLNKDNINMIGMQKIILVEFICQSNLTTSN